MKKLILTTLIVALGAGLTFGQSKTVKKFHEKYKDDRDATVVRLNNSLFKLFATIASFDEDDEDAQVIARISDNIESMDILSVPLFDSGLSPSEFEEMREQLKKEKYEELMEVREGRDRVSFLTQGNANEVKNMVVLIREEDNAVVMNINGTLDMKDLAYLAKSSRKFH